MAENKRRAALAAEQAARLAHANWKLLKINSDLFDKMLAAAEGAANQKKKAQGDLEAARAAEAERQRDAKAAQALLKEATKVSAVNPYAPAK